MNKKQIRILRQKLRNGRLRLVSSLRWCVENGFELPKELLNHWKLKKGILYHQSKELKSKKGKVATRHRALRGQYLGMINHEKYKDWSNSRIARHAIRNEWESVWRDRAKQKRYSQRRLTNLFREWDTRRSKLQDNHPKNQTVSVRF